MCHGGDTLGCLQLASCDNPPVKAYKVPMQRSEDPRDHRRPPESEHTLVLTAIERSRWNMTHAAAELGISRNTLYRRIKQLGIPLPHARRSS